MATGQIKRLLPDRICWPSYLMMCRSESSQLSPDQISTIAGALHLGKGWILFWASLPNWSLSSGQRIMFSCCPGQKLDLQASVSYNRGKNKRTQVLTYLQHCLERGFLDGPKGKNPSYQGFPKPGISFKILPHCWRTRKHSSMQSSSWPNSAGNGRLT